MRGTFDDLEASFLDKIQSDKKGVPMEWSSKAHHMPILDYYSHILDIVANNPELKPKVFAAFQSDKTLKNHVQKIRNKTRTNTGVKTKASRMNAAQKFQNAKNFLNGVSKGKYNTWSFTRKNSMNNNPINPNTQSPTAE
jgi:hypothetical protein